MRVFIYISRISVFQNPRRVVAVSLRTSSPHTHWFQQCPRSHPSPFPRQRCRAADSYGARQMEVVRACATVIPQFNSHLVFSPTPICLKLCCQHRCPLFSEHSAKKPKWPEQLLLPWIPTTGKVLQSYIPSNPDRETQRLEFHYHRWPP